MPIPWRDVQLPGKLTLGVIRDDTIVAPNPPVKRGLQMAVDALQAQGHEIVELEFDPEHFMQGQMLLGRLYGADAGVHIREAFALSGEPFLPALEMYANAQGDGLTPKELWALHLERDAWCKKMAAWWNATASKTQSGQKVDGLIMPTTPYAAPKQHIWAGKGDIGYTNTWNLAGESIRRRAERCKKSLSNPCHPCTFRRLRCGHRPGHTRRPVARPSRHLVLSSK